MREYVCERERESVCMCVRKGGICGNLLEGITSVIQLARVWFGLFFSFTPFWRGYRGGGISFSLRI